MFDSQYSIFGTRLSLYGVRYTMLDMWCLITFELDLGSSASARPNWPTNLNRQSTQVKIASLPPETWSSFILTLASTQTARWYFRPKGYMIGIRYSIIDVRCCMFDLHRCSTRGIRESIRYPLSPNPNHEPYFVGRAVRFRLWITFFTSSETGTTLFDLV